MARDTTAMLHRALEAAENWEAAPTGSAEQHAAAETATGMIVLLHHELHEGGVLPEPLAQCQAADVQPDLRQRRVIVPSYRAAWQQAKGEHRLLLLLNAEAHALAYIADHAIAELAAEVERLKAELDGYQGRTVLHCMDRDLDGAMMTSLDEPDGTILRATDTGREMVLHGRAWLPR